MKNPPDILLQLTAQGFTPYGHHSGPMLEIYAPGQVFTVKARKGRTLPRNGAYWAGLHQAVKATDAWPTGQHLHEDLKRLTGYVDVYHNPLTGRDEIRPQSTAFNKMGEAEFAAYFNLAQLKFAERMGFDPWQREDVA